MLHVVKYFWIPSTAWENVNLEHFSVIECHDCEDDIILRVFIMTVYDSGLNCLYTSFP